MEVLADLLGSPSPTFNEESMGLIINDADFEEYFIIIIIIVEVTQDMGALVYCIGTLSFYFDF